MGRLIILLVLKYLSLPCLLVMTLLIYWSRVCNPFRAGLGIAIFVVSTSFWFVVYIYLLPDWLLYFLFITGMIGMSTFFYGTFKVIKGLYKKNE